MEKEEIIEMLGKNIIDNIKLYSRNNDNYFREIDVIMKLIEEEPNYLVYLNEYSDAFMMLMEEVIDDLKKLPYLYDLRDDMY